MKMENQSIAMGQYYSSTLCARFELKKLDDYSLGQKIWKINWIGLQYFSDKGHPSFYDVVVSPG